MLVLDSIRNKADRPGTSRADPGERSMSKSAPQLFRGVTPDQYSRLIHKAKGAGIDLNGDSGTASKFGVEVAWNYSRASQELSLQTVKTPFFMSAADVDARILSLVRESLA